MNCIKAMKWAIIDMQTFFHRNTVNRICRSLGPHLSFTSKSYWNFLCCCSKTGSKLWSLTMNYIKYGKKKYHSHKFLTSHTVKINQTHKDFSSVTLNTRGNQKQAGVRHFYVFPGNTFIVFPAFATLFLSVLHR